MEVAHLRTRRRVPKHSFRARVSIGGALSLLVRAGATARAAVKKPTGEPIKFLTEIPLIGPSNGNPWVAVGAQVAAKAIDGAGGVPDPAGGPNRPIAVEVRDHKTDPDAPACPLKAVADDVLAVVGSLRKLGTAVVRAQLLQHLYGVARFQGKTAAGRQQHRALRHAVRAQKERGKARIT